MEKPVTLPPFLPQIPLAMLWARVWILEWDAGDSSSDLWHASGV